MNHIQRVIPVLQWLNESQCCLKEDWGGNGEKDNYGTNDVGNTMILLATLAPIAVLVYTLALGVMICHM